jgi:hypothetical protein
MKFFIITAFLAANVSLAATTSLTCYLDYAGTEPKVPVEILAGISVSNALYLALTKSKEAGAAGQENITRVNGTFLNTVFIEEKESAIICHKVLGHKTACTFYYSCNPSEISLAMELGPSQSKTSIAFTVFHALRLHPNAIVTEQAVLVDTGKGTLSCEEQKDEYSCLLRGLGDRS